MTQASWSGDLAKSIARELRRHRERRGLSAQDLSDACARLGVPIQRSVIANFENGRRSSIGVAELLAFSAVLQVPPVWLIAPMGFEPSIEILPGVRRDPYAVASWVSGYNSRTDDEEEIYCGNPVPLAEDLGFTLSEIEVAQEKIDEISPRVSNLTPELEQVQELIGNLVAEFESARDAQRATLDSIKSMSLEERTSGKAKAMLESTDSGIRVMEERASKIAELTEKKVDLEQGVAELASYENWKTTEEGNAREIIAKFRASGWLPPTLPDHLKYLLDEPKKSDLSQPAGRRRKKY